MIGSGIERPCVPHQVPFSDALPPRQEISDRLIGVPT